ncbi:hypothetical protein N7340_12930 [Comamonas aquatica]|uniref:hypothetical protein n=1 Tax=Comamonas aquatica TaxID=225991 RepID=UPI00244BEA7D|nr:hypothetical protein [Comamonas aquatica]MDH0372673.1 hypothetical protein [Comamonas aquatica]
MDGAEGLGWCDVQAQTVRDLLIAETMLQAVLHKKYVLRSIFEEHFRHMFVAMHDEIPQLLHKTFTNELCFQWHNGAATTGPSFATVASANRYSRVAGGLPTS